jgi:hypothetical protein
VALATRREHLPGDPCDAALISETTAALLQLNPIIANTPTRYQMVPSAVSVTRLHSEITDDEAFRLWRKFAPD